MCRKGTQKDAVAARYYLLITDLSQSFHVLSVSGSLETRFPRLFISVKGTQVKENRRKGTIFLPYHQQWPVKCGQMLGQSLHGFWVEVLATLTLGLGVAEIIGGSFL